MDIQEEFSLNPLMVSLQILCPETFCVEQSWRVEKSETTMREGSQRYQPEGHGHTPVLPYGYPSLVKSVLAPLENGEKVQTFLCLEFVLHIA